jgi:hypothetical protein
MLAVLLLAAAGSEFAYRRLSPMDAGERAALENLRSLVDGKPGRYEPRAYTSYGLTPRRGNTNTLGFHGPEWTLEPAPGVTRIMCLGGSTTEGGNAEGTVGSYPHLLEEGLERRFGRDFEVMNCGVSGWTSAETMVTWFLLLQDYNPDFVIVHHVVNDAMPRDAPGFRADYGHWRTAFRPPHFNPAERLLIHASDFYARRRLRDAPDTIELSTRRLPGKSAFEEHGMLPAESALPYRRNLLSLGRSVEAHGARFCLMTMPAKPPLQAKSMYYGLVEHNRIMRELARENGWILIDAAERLPGYPGYSAEAFFLDIVHMTSQGNRAKATLAGAALLPYL